MITGVSMQKGKSLFYILGLSCLVSGCQISTNSPSDSASLADENKMMRKEVDELRGEIRHHRDLRKIMAQYEDRISRLESVADSLNPTKENNMAVMANNKKSKEEAGGGALSEVFYLVQTAYSELDVQAASLASQINDAFYREDFIQENLYKKLEDKVVEITLKISETTVRRSQHMAADRRLVTSRLKALNESFLALRNLAENKVFDLSINQHKNLYIKSNSIRVEYAKILKTDFFPVIPQLVPLASGEEYLNNLSKMNDTMVKASTLVADKNGSESSKIFKDLTALLKKKTSALK